MSDSKLEELEIRLLLEAVFEKYGYDFRDYAMASVRRRILSFMEIHKIEKISELIPLVLHNKKTFNLFIKRLSITVTEMFRDPFVYKFIRENVIDILRTYPFIKVWHAGCASGEEVYSLAILLKEEGLLERTQIYATDFNNIALNKAKEGIFDIKNIKKYSVNYRDAGGKDSLSSYYHSKYDSVMMNNELKKNITFANHNLITDTVFGEMHLIFCRNVMIYFNKELQGKVFDLFDKSLIPRGFLCLGSKESLKFSTIEEKYNTLGLKERVYQKLS
ncbi:MAG: protein-glutamate O-methyltransferase CheR [Melioribacteraceae bacterium]|nr:protein-glutamate O-methyltransferase CheR [Melioribacteraceae bacterium]